MQFKARTAKDGSTTWSVIRWTYDASKKRSLPAKVGTVSEIDLRKTDWPAGLMIHGRLSAAEQHEFAAWHAATREPIAKEMHQRWLSRGLADSSVLVAAVEAGHCTQAMADALWERIDRLAAALRKAKLTRKTPAKMIAGHSDPEAERPATEAFHGGEENHG